MFNSDAHETSTCTSSSFEKSVIKASVEWRENFLYWVLFSLNFDESTESENEVSRHRYRITLVLSKVKKIEDFCQSKLAYVPFKLAVTRLTLTVILKRFEVSALSMQKNLINYYTNTIQTFKYPPIGEHVHLQALGRFIIFCK